MPSQSDSCSGCGSTFSSRISGSRQATSTSSTRHAAGEAQRRAQPDVLAEPAAEQRAGRGGQQREPAHRARHAAQQRLGRDGLAQRQEVDEDEHRAGAEAHQHQREGRHAPGIGRRHGQQQPAAAADRIAHHQAGPGADAAADAAAEARCRRWCPRPCPCSTGPPPAPTGPACAWRTGSAPSSPRSGTSARRPSAPPASAAGGGRRRSAGRPSGRARSARRRARSRRSCTRMPRRMSAETSSSTASTSSASGAPTSLISAPARPGPGHLGARAGQRILGMRLDQPLARHHLRQHDLRRACRPPCARCRSRSPPRTASSIDSQPSHQASGTLAAASASTGLADHVHRQLAHAVEPHARGQREQHEGQHLDGRQQRPSAWAWPAAAPPP